MGAALSEPMMPAATVDLVDRHGVLASTVAWIGVCALIVVAPFEKTRPIVQMSGQSISSVETALLLVFGAWTTSLVLSGSIRTWRMLADGRASLALPWMALLAALLFSALTAPTNRVNAVHMVGRLGLALGVYLLTVNGITSARQLKAVFSIAAVTGVVVGLLVILEYLGVAPVLRLLRLFRPGTILVGAQVRATGPLQYPTIASMYLEILFGFVSALLLTTIDARRRSAAAVVALALLVIGEAIVLTFTRAGFLTMIAALAVIGALRHRRMGFDTGVRVLAAFALVISAQFFTSRSFEMLRLRLTTEGAAWYAGTFEVPRELALATGATTDVRVAVTNTGQTTWEPDAPQPFHLSYHWLLAKEDLSVSWEGIRTVFPSPVGPGQSVSLLARVRAPGRPGQYRLLWDIEEEHRRWFSSEPGAELFTSKAMVSGPATVTQPLQLTPLPRKAERPGRLVLWGAAVRMLAERPLRGVGPDNFRLLYGPYANLTNADPRVHSNNMYLELVVGGGALAAAALAWFLARATRLFRTLERPIAATPLSTLSAGVLASGIAIALHGIVDSFLGFTATYILIAITLGLASACATLSTSDAHRV